MEDDYDAPHIPFSVKDIDDTVTEVIKKEPGMDIVVVLALVVLCFVFLLSLVILVITCQRRRHKNPASSKLLVPFETPPARFTRPVNDSIEEIETMEELNTLLGELLDKNPWLFEARGIMQHVVAVLSICRSMTIKLSGVQLPASPSPFHYAINMALRNTYPRFDDLIESLAAQPIDMRLLEARAMSLGTVCWSLYLPYTLLNIAFKEVLQKPLNEMNMHLVTIRTAAHLISMAEKGTEETLDLVDLKDYLMRMRRQVRGDMLFEDDYGTEDDLDDDVIEDDDEEVRPEAKILAASDHEKMPLVSSEAVIDMVELTKVPLVHHETLLSNGKMSPQLISNNGRHHHHHHHHHHHQNDHIANGSLNTVDESTEDDHHGEGTSTSCSSSSASSSSSTHPIDPKA